jgi:signal transduction histidine kinase
MGTVAAHLRNLRRTMIGGGPDPPPLLAPAYPARLSRAVPALLVVAAVLLGLFTIQYAVASSGVVTVVWTLSALSLALVGFRPLLAWRIAWLLGVVSLLLDHVAGSRPAGSSWRIYGFLVDWPDLPTAWFPAQIVVFLVILFAVGTAQHRGVLLWVWLASAGLTWIAFVGLDVHFLGYDGTDVWAAMLMVTGVPLAGYLVRLGARAQHRLAEAEEQGTVLTERARIARELHDVVAHHVSMISVRAETAPYRLGELSEPARAELAEISQASRQALAEMRRLLGVLRSGEPAPLTAPQPGVADLAELVAAARAAGSNEVTLDIDAGLPALPAAVDVSAYRIVQEALTNAARHAPGAPVRVAVGRTAGGLALSVRNGLGRPSRSDAGPGHGVRGMRERAAMLGGELRAGPVGDGGFEVSATLPLSAVR